MRIYKPESLLAIGFIDGLTRDGEMDARFVVPVWVFMTLFLCVRPPVFSETGGFYVKKAKGKRRWRLDCQIFADAFGADASNVARRDVPDVQSDVSRAG